MGYNDSLQSRFTAMHWLAVIMFGAIIVWVDSAESVFKTGDGPSRDPSSEEVYALVGGMLGMVWCIVTILIMKFAEAQTLFFTINAVLMWIFWTLNVAFFTFDSPYRNLKNGWIASWVCFIFSTMHLGAVSEWVREKMSSVEGKVRSLSLNLTWILGCVFASTIELVAASILCNKFCSLDIVRYAVAVGVIGIFLPLLLIISSIPDSGHLLIAVLNCVWWMIALLVLTLLKDVFVPISSANGYFATWAASIFSILIAFPYLNAVGCVPKRNFGGNSAAAGNSDNDGAQPNPNNSTWNNPPPTSSSQDVKGVNAPYRGTGGNGV